MYKLDTLSVLNTITGSLSGSVTGNVIGTASFASTASYAIAAAVTLTIDGGSASTTFTGTDITFDGGGA